MSEKLWEEVMSYIRRNAWALWKICLVMLWNLWWDNSSLFRRRDTITFGNTTVSGTFVKLRGSLQWGDKSLGHMTNQKMIQDSIYKIKINPEILQKISDSELIYCSHCHGLPYQYPTFSALHVFFVFLSCHLMQHEQCQVAFCDTVPSASPVPCDW